MLSGLESALIERCRQGEPTAWDDLFDTYYEPTARFVFQLAHDLGREDVEEICQEVFLNVIKSLDSFQGNCQLQTWICRIAANKTADFRERQQAAKRGGGRPPLSLQAEDPETGLTLDPPSGLPLPDQVLLKAEQAALIQDCLDQVGQPCRELLELRYFGDLSYEEISKALEMNPKTVSSRLSKCLDRLEHIARKTFAGANSPVFPSNQ
jgi:RNA polymerase sigma-70 factor (ECF subfamily)